MSDPTPSPAAPSPAAPSPVGRAETDDAPASIRVFLLDDHEMVRRGVRDMLESTPDIVVVGEAGTAAEAMSAVREAKPDIAVLDIRLPDGDGIAICREIRAEMPNVSCLMLTSYPDDDALYESIVAGASGYILKEVAGADLVSAIRTVAAGHSIIDPVTTARVMERLRTDPRSRDPLYALTDQERRILRLIGEGLTNRQIAERLFLAEKTVKNYVSTMLGKLGMRRRTQAAMLAGKLREKQNEPKP